MTFAKKNLENQNVLWKFCIKEALMVIGCIVLSFILGIIFAIIVGIISLGLLLYESIWQYILALFTLFGFLVGLFKAIIDIVIFTRENT